MKFAVIYKSPNRNFEVYGPFDDVAAAKSWMAQDLADTFNAAKNVGKEVIDFWHDENNETYAHCELHISNRIDTWKIAEFFEN